jgi:hypothetical protein
LQKERLMVELGSAIHTWIQTRRCNWHSECRMCTLYCSLTWKNRLMSKCGITIVVAPMM